MGKSLIKVEGTVPRTLNLKRSPMVVFSETQGIEIDTFKEENSEHVEIDIKVSSFKMESV